jgi:hypothetical protein
MSLTFCSPYEIRFYNDQLLQLERAFLNPLGQGGDHTDSKYESFVFLTDFFMTSL